MMSSLAGVLAFALRSSCRWVVRAPANKSVKYIADISRTYSVSVSLYLLIPAFSKTMDQTAFSNSIATFSAKFCNVSFSNLLFLYLLIVNLNNYVFIKSSHLCLFLYCVCDNSCNINYDKELQYLIK